MRLQPISIYKVAPIFKNRAQSRMDYRTVNSNTQTDNLINFYTSALYGYNSNTDEYTYDSFTKLRDKNCLFSVLSKRMKKCERKGKKLSLAMFDMDNFKSVNELLGYKVGDDFIKNISGTVDKIAKKHSLHAYRYGGDEFVILFNEQNEKQQQEIVDEITSAINSNPKIPLREKEYVNNANNKLNEYLIPTKKINTLISLKGKKEIYSDLKENMTTEEGKKDPYLLKSADDTDIELNSQYLTLLGSSIREENDSGNKIILTNFAKKIGNNVVLSEQEQTKLDEYLNFHYNKSHEIYQIKKWLDDFNYNQGFKITGVAISFKPKFLKDKEPSELIQIAGEELKAQKHAKKRKTISIF